jgi:hypothetical protein
MDTLVIVKRNRELYERQLFSRDSRQISDNFWPGVILNNS